MDPAHLIAIARGLAGGAIGGGLGRPRQADLRRALSAAYYAMFHALAQCCADTLVGATPASRSRSAWTQTYRALEHGYARNQCVRAAGNREFPQAVRKFSEGFVRMQRLRQMADYAPDSDFSRSVVLQLVTDVESDIAGFASVSAADRAAFSAYVLLRTRAD